MTGGTLEFECHPLQEQAKLVLCLVPQDTPDSNPSDALPVVWRVFRLKAHEKTNFSVTIGDHRKVSLVKIASNKVSSAVTSRQLKKGGEHVVLVRNDSTGDSNFAEIEKIDERVSFHRVSSLLPDEPAVIGLGWYPNIIRVASEGDQYDEEEVDAAVYTQVWRGGTVRVDATPKIQAYLFKSSARVAEFQILSRKMSSREILWTHNFDANSHRVVHIYVKSGQPITRYHDFIANIDQSPSSDVDGEIVYSTTFAFNLEKNGSVVAESRGLAQKLKDMGHSKIKYIPTVGQPRARFEMALSDQSSCEDAEKEIEELEIDAKRLSLGGVIMQFSADELTYGIPINPGSTEWKQNFDTWRKSHEVDSDGSEIQDQYLKDLLLWEG